MKIMKIVNLLFRLYLVKKNDFKEVADYTLKNCDKFLNAGNHMLNIIEKITNSV